ncbi:hypothetical protein D0Z07_4480 [Hyphodiscus hymeniophilus]|uniref:NB-ARC domain-containing protein n=1 Tax=Hyphodiscus hymeniophilus TaxID=353542 RepID=A0A9P6VK30_9HELO|nr:hypothetical protein D0Z07_4480 [Hyphodiscus hymeniophilus]
MGKTQLAITYAKRFKEKYMAIFWLSANDEDSLKLSFQNVAQQVLRYHPSNSTLSSLDLDKDPNEDLDQVISQVKAWLDLPENTRWLMIYDNLDNPKTPGNPDTSAVDIRQFLPRSDHGSIIITSRSSQIRQGERIPVQKLLDIREGLKIVSNMSGRLGIEKDLDAVALVEELDGLPLALSTAGAYLEHVITSFSYYLRLYKASWLMLQTTSPQLSSYEYRSLYSTWQITFDRIQQQNPVAANLLKFWAYFDRQDIWYELLRHISFVKEEWAQKLSNELNFNKAITLLCSFGLVDPDPSLQQQFGSGGYSMHSCMHSWTMFVLNKEWDERFAQLALTCVASDISMRDERNSWISQRRLLQHATRQEQFIREDKVDLKGMEWDLQMLGLLYLGQGKLAEAEPLFTRALQGNEEALGPRDISTLVTVNNLGHVYFGQGKLVKAEAKFTRALQGYEEALGPRDIETLQTVITLGNLYNSQGKLVEAEAMYTRALQGYEEALGPRDIETLRTIDKLGNFYYKQRKLVEAEAMYTRALQGYEEVFGPQIMSLYLPALNTMTGFGNVYSDTGRETMAKEMYTRALSGYRNIRGPFSKQCRELEARLRELEVASV